MLKQSSAFGLRNCARRLFSGPRVRPSPALACSAALLFICTCTSGCAGMPPAQVGQTIGTMAGSLIAPGIGAPLGALVGLLGGMLVQGEVDKVTEKKERQELGQAMGAASASPSSADAPALSTTPVRVWVDERLQDGRLQPGHFDVRPLPST